MNASERPERLRVMVTFKNLFYTPIYVAVGGGFLYEQGLDVMFGTVPEGQPSFDLLRRGEVDVVQSGISRSLMDLDEGREDAPLHIAEINQRDGFFLVSRHPAEGWRWKDLEGASLIPVGFTPVPLMSLKAALKKHGVDLGRIKLMDGLSAEEALRRFRQGEADYIHMVNPHAQALVEEQAGHLAAAIGPELGYICYSSFAVTPGFLEERPQAARKFVRGFHKALQWMAASSAGDIAGKVAPFFPETDRGVLERSIGQYLEQQTWPEDPFIGEDGYAAMRDLLIDGGLVRGRHPYDRVVRPEFAQEALGE